MAAVKFKAFAFMKISVVPVDSSFLDPEEYYRNPIVSNSGLGAFLSKVTDSQGMNAKPETLRFGQLMHLGLYEYDEFKQSPEALSEPTKSFRQCLRMIEAGRKTPVLSGFLKNPNTVYEVPYYAIINGVPVKVKPDAFIQTTRFGHDAKSTATTKLDDFIESFKKYGYWRQAALYTLATLGKNWYFTGISKTEPHKTFIVDCSKFKAEMKQGRIEAIELLRMYSELHPNYIETAKKYLRI